MFAGNAAAVSPDADGEREAEGEEEDAPIESSESESHSCLMYPMFWALECIFPGIKKPDLPACVCCVAWFRAFRFHFGTLAVTSFIIAVVQLIQTIAAYVLLKMKTSGTSNPVVTKIMYAVQGALTALQCCIKHINKSMYAVATMKGHGFFASLQHTGMLLTSNILTVSALKISSLFIIILGKGMVTLASALSCYLWLAYGSDFAEGSDRELSSNLLPFSINVLVAFLVATAFFYTCVSTSLRYSFRAQRTSQCTHPHPCSRPYELLPWQSNDHNSILLFALFFWLLILLFAHHNDHNSRVSIGTR